MGKMRDVLVWYAANPLGHVLYAADLSPKAHDTVPGVRPARSPPLDGGTVVGRAPSMIPAAAALKGQADGASRAVSGAALRSDGP
jgi:hypothetical protein